MPRVEILYDIDENSTSFDKTRNSGYRIISHVDCQKDCCHGKDKKNKEKDKPHGLRPQLENKRKSIVVVPDSKTSPSPRSLARLEALSAAGQNELTFNTRRKTQKKTGALFTDPDFPAVANSIFPSRNSSKYEWKRPRDICQDPRFILDGVSRFDVRQGELGNCWILAAIASLSLQPDLFEQVVPVDQNFQNDYCGMFRFRLWQFGEWVDVIVDDLLPTYKGKLVFMHSTDKNEFWSALLEKAFAKLNGSYEALTGGNQTEAMEDFTGGLCETFETKDWPQDKMLYLINQASKANSLMGCSIDVADDSEMEAVLPNGLIKGHAYSITGIAEANLTNRQVVTLIRVRNPWGNEAEWTGNWGDSSDKWKLVTEAEKKRIGYSDADDGEFWMEFKDFYVEFKKVEVCHLGPANMGSGAEPRTKTEGEKNKKKWEECLEVGNWIRNVTAGGCRNNITSFHTNPQYRVEIVDADDGDNLGTIIIGLMQKNVRRKNMGEFFTIGYTLYKIEDPNCGPLDQTFFKFNKSADRSPNYINQREVCGRHRLPPGHYVIIPTTFEPNEEAEFIVRIFSEKPNNSDSLDHVNQIQDVKESDLKKKKTDKPETPEDDEPLRQAFLNFAGPTAKIHARQLQKILNVSFSKGVTNFEGFALEACRSMLALVDFDLSGFMEFAEFKILWNLLKMLKTVFKDHDADGNGTFNAFELRDALKHAGYIVNNKVFEAIALRYTDYEKGVITFEDYILLSVRLKIAFDTYIAMPKTGSNTGEITQDHFLLQTLYL